MKFPDILATNDHRVIPFRLRVAATTAAAAAAAAAGDAAAAVGDSNGTSISSRHPSDMHSAH